MEFDLLSYSLGIIATVIGSSVVTLFSLWVHNQSNKKRAIKSLFSEIEHNYIIDKRLMGEDDTFPKHWAYKRIPFQIASFEYAKQNGYLYSLKTESYERISKAYDVILLIQKEGYGVTGTANVSFKFLKDLLKEIIDKDIQQLPN
jgi:hypothetical protein